MEDFMDVYWSLPDILQGEMVDRGHNSENICIVLFHVSEQLDHFGSLRRLKLFHFSMFIFAIKSAPKSFVTN